jgi:GxxExxY protein
MNLEARKPGMELGNTELTDRIIAAAIRVHTELGPGFLENMYEEALALEFAGAGLRSNAKSYCPFSIVSMLLENIVSILSLKEK